MTATESKPADAGELTALPRPQPPDLIQLAIERNMDADSIAKLVSLIERREQIGAQRRFGDALAGFQAEAPMVFKHRQADRYKFASLDDVMREARPVMAKWGISVSFDTEHAEAEGDKGIAKLTVICRVRVGAHYEDHRFTSPVPSGMKLTEPQLFGQGLTYLKRYALCAALNIVVTDDPDHDAAGLFELIDKGDVAQLAELIEEKGADLERFLKWAEIESLDRMAKKQLPKALDMLRRKQKAGAA